MNLSTSNSLSVLVESLFSINLSSNTKLNQRYQSNIQTLLEAMQLVRQHRAITQRALIGGKLDRLSYDFCQEALLDMADELVRLKSFGTTASRNLVKREIVALASNPDVSSIANNLVAHGKMIRSLIFKLDEQMISLITLNQNEHLAGEYSEHWQNVMSAIDALTQYRVALTYTGNTAKTDTIYARGQLLLRRVAKVEEYASLSNIDSEGSLTSIREFLHRQDFQEVTEKSLLRNYILTSKVSAYLLEVYQAVIEDTQRKVVVQSNTRTLGA
jgi:hypothetical protein